MIRTLIDKHVLSSRKNQTIILVCIVQIYLIFGHIIPGYTKAPYFQEKIRNLQAEKEQLILETEHLVYYRTHVLQAEQSLKRYLQEIREIIDDHAIQKQLNSMIQSSNMELESLQFEDPKQYEDIAVQTVHLTLQGHYPQILRFLNNLTELSRFLIISDCTVQNTDQLSQTPILVMDLSLSIYTPLFL